MKNQQKQSTALRIWNLKIIMFSLTLLTCLSCKSETALTADSQGVTPSGQQLEKMIQIVNPDGKSDYEIVVDQKGPQVAREGAKELQRLLLVVTGIELPVVEAATSNRHQIVIGAHPLATAAGVTTDGLGVDGFRMRIIDNNLYLAGEDLDRGEFFELNNGESSHGGSYFAVIEFAERFLGVHWYMPGPLGEEALHRDRISIPADLNLTMQPRFAIRSINIAMGSIRPSSLEFSHKYLIKKQQSGMFEGDYFDAAASIEATRWGRRMRLGSTFPLEVAHAWFQWVPAEKPNGYVSKAYGKEHPEYFALRNGQRVTRYLWESHGGQLCVSNPDVARTYAENIITYAKRTGERAFSLSPNDGAEHCECESCRAWDVEKDVSGEPILTDRLVRFANAVAEQVVVAVPDVTFGWYAYHDTRVPPRQVKLHPSIVISDVYNGIPWLYNSPVPHQMMESDIRGWRAKSQRVVLTSYYLIEGFWSLPWSTLDEQDWFMKLLAEYPSSAGVRMCYTGPGDLPPMGMLGADPWVLGKLMWNPDQSAADLTREYYRGAFGDTAGAALQEYFDTINKSFEKAIADRPSLSRHGDGALSGSALIIAGYTPVRERCGALIQKAIAEVAKGEERYRWRVDRIARAWRLAELTLDGIEAAKEARQSTGEGRTAAWEKAVNIGKERQALAASPDSRFAIAVYSKDYMDKSVPLGVIKEIPGGENLRLAVPMVKDALVVDGKLDEPAFKQSSLSSSFKENYKGGTPIAATQVRVFYSAKGLSIGFQCSEPQMTDLRVTDDPNKIWDGDVVEIFLVPTDGLDSYVQFSVNPNGIGKPIIKRGDRGTDMNWQPDWKYAANKVSDSWSVEVLIPWTSLGLTGAPSSGTEWYANFFRERVTGQTELSGWSPTGSGFANPTKFGRIQFKP